MELSSPPPPDFRQVPDSNFLGKSWSRDLSFADLLTFKFSIVILAQKCLTNISHESSEELMKTESEKAVWKANMQSFLDYLSHSCNLRPP